MHNGLYLIILSDKILSIIILILIWVFVFIKNAPQQSIAWPVHCVALASRPVWLRFAHRNPAVRKKAAEFLMKAGTKAAFRGIILAAKDPDEEVRIQVVKALDQMNSPNGLPILEELKNDPDKRVKRYTLWAMERYEAKKLV